MKKTKTFRSGERRSSRHHRVATPEEHSPEGDDDSVVAGDDEAPIGQEGLGGMAWECIAVTLEDVRQFLESINKSRDQNEKVLHRQLEHHLVPILAKQEEARQRKELQRERDLLSLAKMANAKRSSRIAGKRERQEEEDKEREEERSRREEETVRRREEQKRLRLEKDRDVRMHSREKRLKEREQRRLLHEEELAQLSENSKATGSGNERMSERRRKLEIERNKQALQEIDDEEEDWIFDCICGLYGQIDDGSHSVACEKCSVWQHSHCLGIQEAEAERPEFHFVCASCTRREEEATQPKRLIKIKINRPGSPGSQALGDGPPEHSETTTKPISELPHDDNIVGATISQPSEHSPSSNDTQRSEVDGTDRALPTNSSLPILTTAPTSPGRNIHDSGKKLVQLQQQENEKSMNVLHMGQETAGQNSFTLAADVPASNPPPATVVASTPASVKRLNDGENASLGLSSPHISQEIHHSARNGAVPSQAVCSPTKHSPGPHQSPSPGKIKSGISIIPPATNLSPTPHPMISTPPVKSADPRPYSSFRSSDSAQHHPNS